MHFRKKNCLSGLEIINGLGVNVQRSRASLKHMKRIYYSNEIISRPFSSIFKKGVKFLCP
jgi:hypothetical protein